MRLSALTAVLGLVALVLPSVQAAPTGEGIVVAVLDSGVDGTNPELSGRVERVFFQPAVSGLPIPLDPGQAFADPDGQGTAVASIIAGATVGLAPQARILDYQVSARYTGTTLDPAAEQSAIQAMDRILQDPGRVDVVILSFASRGVSAAGAQTLAEQAQGLHDAGVLVIVPLAATMSQLQADKTVVTVGGTDCSGAHQADSSHPRKPDLVAPSQNIRAAQASTTTNPTGSGTTTVSGTAYAAAQAAGVGALLFDVRDDLPVDAAASILRDTSADSSTPGPDDCTGFGLLTRDAAVAGAETWQDPLEIYPTKPTPGLGLPLLVVAIAVGAVLRRRA